MQIYIYINYIFVRMLFKIHWYNSLDIIKWIQKHGSFTDPFVGYDIRKYHSTTKWSELYTECPKTWLYNGIWQKKHSTKWSKWYQSFKNMVIQQYVYHEMLGKYLFMVFLSIWSNSCEGMRNPISFTLWIWS